MVEQSSSAPPKGTDHSLDTALETTWGEPLYLLIAAFVAAGDGRIGPALSMHRLELVEYAAKRERDELLRRASREGRSTTARDVWRALLPRIAAWNTVAEGLRRETLVAGCQAEAERLGYQIDGGPGIVVDRLVHLYSVHDGRILPIQPAPVAEAFVLGLMGNNPDELDRCVNFAAGPAFERVEQPVRFLAVQPRVLGGLAVIKPLPAYV
jgi:hypothetical protein